MKAYGWRLSVPVEAVATGRSANSCRNSPAMGRTGGSRYFFIAIGAWCILIAVAGFAPSFYAFFTGEWFIPPIVHVHAVLMLSWLALYTTQATSVANANLARHRRMGWLAVWLAATVWIFMGVATIVALKRFDPDQMPFLVKPLLIQLGTMAMFPIFFAWAVLARRQADWHRRLMTLATFVLVQPALDRMHWLPAMDLPGFWDSGLRGYVLLLLPLFLFDIFTLRRIHPATLIGSALIIAMHAVVSFYWADEGWNQLARGFWMWLR